MSEGSYIDPADTHRTVFRSLDHLGGDPVGHRGCSGSLLPAQVRRHTCRDALGRGSVRLSGYACVPGSNLPEMDPGKASAKLSRMLSQRGLGGLPRGLSHYRRIPVPDSLATGDHVDVFGICLAPHGAPRQDEGFLMADTVGALDRLAHALDLLETHVVWEGLQEGAVVGPEGQDLVPLGTQRRGGLLTVDCLVAGPGAPRGEVAVVPRHLRVL